MQANGEQLRVETDGTNPVINTGAHSKILEKIIVTDGLLSTQNELKSITLNKYFRKFKFECGTYRVLIRFEVKDVCMHWPTGLMFEIGEACGALRC